MVDSVMRMELERRIDRLTRIWSIWLTTGLCVLALVPRVHAQAPQQPLQTQVPETVGAGVVQFDVGGDYGRDRTFSASGLTGNLWRVPLLTMTIGLGSIVDLQFTGGLHDHLAITSRQPAPLASQIVGHANATTDFDDLVVSTKVRLLRDARGSRRPALSLLFGTELPNAKPYSGLGTSTTNVALSGLAATDVGPVRLIVNLGLGVLGDPVSPHHHQNVLTYGAAITRQLSRRLAVMGDVAGRIDLGAAPPPPGTEDTGTLRLGARYERWRGWWSGAVTVGLTSRDAAVGVLGAYTFALHLFRVP